MIACAWLLSSQRRVVAWRVVAGGLLLQLTLGVLLLRTSVGISFFQQLGIFFNAVLGYVEEGAGFVFNIFPRDGDAGFPPPHILVRSIAFGVLPTIVFFSSLMAILYHLRLVQPVVAGLAWLMHRTLGTSGAESLSAAANIFVGQTEAPLVIRPYVAAMTLSELMAVMVGGFATIAGGVMAAYVKMGIDAGHLMTASVISAPAALLIAKVMQPEVEQPKTLGHVRTEAVSTNQNVIEAAASGAADGLMLALNVGAMLVAFVALVAMVNGILGWLGSLVSFELSQVLDRPDPQWEWSLEVLFGYIFYPFAWLMGVPSDECMPCGRILGTKMVVNEFVAYSQLAGAGTLSERTHVIMTYALCGFANFGSIGIQIGGISGIAPERRADLARLGLRAMIGGTLAAFMTACVAAMLYQP
jgi:CNT family concentrative nucleoside transporter